MLTRVGGNRSLLRRLLVDFRDKQGAAARGLRAALTAGDIERAERLAHDFKGFAGNVGAPEVVERAAALEAAIANRELELEPMLAAFEKAMATAVAAIGELATKPTENETDSSAMSVNDTIEQLGPDISELMRLLANNHLDARRHFAFLKERLAAKIDARLLEELEEKIAGLAYGEARHSVGLIAKRLALEV